MNHFVYIVGISYLPLHAKALEIAGTVGSVEVRRDLNKQHPSCIGKYQKGYR